MNPRILVLTAGFGEGHNAAAKALAAAATELHGPDTAVVADVFALARPRTNALARRWYLSLINRAPGLWRRTYAWLDRSKNAGAVFHGLGRERRVLQRLLAAERPAALCSTYPVYAFLLAAIARRSAAPRPPHFNVVTDSISINSLWWRIPCAGWYVPNADSADVLLDAGVPAGRIRTLGFPVAPAFSTARPRPPIPPPSAWFRPRVLYIINSGTRGAAETARRLLAQEHWDVTCTVGRNEPLRRELEALSRKRAVPANILGWTPEIPQLLMTHHVVVSKAGGATTQEALAAGCPMIVNQIVPGQEEGNYELLRRHGIGGLAARPDEVLRLVQEAFSADGRQWRQWRAAVEQLSRPNAAREIVVDVISEVSGAGGSRGAGGGDLAVARAEPRTGESPRAGNAAARAAQLR